MAFPCTAELRKGLALAQSEAHRLGQHVGPAHLLYAILATPNSSTRQFLFNHLSVDNLQTELRALVRVQPVHRGPTTKPVPLTDHAKSIVELSIRDVITRDIPWCTADVMLGVVEDGSSKAADLLAEHGVTLKLARECVAQVLATNGESAMP